MSKSEMYLGDGTPAIGGPGPDEVVDLLYKPVYIAADGTEYVNPYAQFKVHEDGTRELVGGFETYSLGPDADHQSVRIPVGTRITLPKKGGAWLADRLADNPFFDIRIRPDTREIRQLNHPRITRLSEAEWAKARVEEAEQEAVFLPPVPAKGRGRRG